MTNKGNKTTKKRNGKQKGKQDNRKRMTDENKTGRTKQQGTTHGE